MCSMSLFPLPLSVVKHIEKLQGDFLCGVGLVKSFNHLVSWSKVCTLISKGGLGIRNLLRLGRFGQERQALWRVVMDSKYGSSWGGWCSRAHVGAYGVNLWKNIRRVWEKFCSYIRFDVGDSSKVRF
jgi:hypothetical protein